MPRDDSPGAIARWHWRGVGCFVVALLGMLASVPPVANASTLVVGDDKGGRLVDRVQIIDTHRRAGTSIEIRGSYCLSACTMYLSLDSTCVAPDTVFGFHGPSSPLYGIALSPAVFERWSLVMADHYPEPIKAWFLKSGRHRTVGFHRISGTQLIRMGISRCADA